MVVFFVSPGALKAQGVFWKQLFPEKMGLNGKEFREDTEAGHGSVTNMSVPQFPQLLNENNNSNSHMQLWAFKESLFVQHFE